MPSQPVTATPVPLPEANGPETAGKTTVFTSNSPTRAPFRAPAPKRWSRGAKSLAAAAGLLLAVTGSGAAWYFFGNLRAERTDLLLHTVRRERLQLTIVERGALESANNRDVTCRVKAGAKNSTIATTIKSVIDDGTQVKQGQLLAELDDSGLQEQLKSEKIVVDQAYAAWIQADENYKIVESQNKSDIETAKVALELAKLDLEKYLRGDYEQTKKDIEGRMLIARSDLEMWEERSAWSQRMSRRGYVTISQSQADQARLQSANIAMQRVQEEMRVLEEFTAKRTIKDWESKIAEAERALDRVKKQAVAKEVQADADRKAKDSIYRQELSRYHEVEDEIKKCTITAPQDGLVVYFVPEQSRYGSGSQQSIVAQGEPVREGQKLMRIPDLTKMVVITRVHEAMVARVRGEVWERTGFSDCLHAGLLLQTDPAARLVAQAGFSELRQELTTAYREQEQRLVYGGQQASIRIDSFPDRVLRGHVKSVAGVASQSDWMSSDVKVYQTVVSIDEPVEGLRPGMSAEVTVLTDSRAEDVPTVPVQAIIGAAELGSKRKCYVLTPQGPAEREIVVGLSNDKMAEIKSGLEEGETIILNPRTLLSEKERAQAGAPRAGAGEGGSSDKGGKGEGGKGGKGGKGKGGKGKGPGGPPPGEGPPAGGPAAG